MTTPYFFKRDAKIALNSVNSGSLQYVAASASDYLLYNVGDKVQITDHQDNWIMDGFIIDKARSKVNIVTLYVEDAGKFLRDYNVEDNAPEDGEPVCCSIRDLLQDYILPATWGLDTSKLAIYDEYERKLNWVVRYAVRNGTSLKHVNNLCDTMRMRWVAKWKPSLSRFDLCLYPIAFSNTSVLDGVDPAFSLRELTNTTQFNAVDSARSFVTSIQVVGAEQESGQQITYCQKDFVGATQEDNPYSAWGYGYSLSSDTYCNSIDLSPGETVVELMDSDCLTGWATETASIVQFNHDPNYYRFKVYNGAEIRDIKAYLYPPWKSTDPSTFETEGLSLSHALNDEIFLTSILVDRPLSWTSATSWAWLGNEVISFERVEVASQGVPCAPDYTRLCDITRGLNGVRYVHRQGTLVRPYYATPPTDTLLSSVGTISVSVSAPGFVEQDGLDKLAEGVLGTATYRFSSKTERVVATLNSDEWYPGLWILTEAASVQGSTLATDTPSVTMIKSVSYSLGNLVSIEFGTSIPEIIRTAKESVSALDLAMQKPRQSAAGEIVDISKNQSCVKMKIAKCTKERFRNVDGFDESEDTNYIERWVRVK